MKKKLFTILITVSLMATVFTGCVSEESNDVANMIESLEARHESGPGVYDPDSEEAKSSLNLRKDMESEEESATKDTSVEKAAETDEDGKDWSEAYDGYFDRGNTLPEMSKVTMYAYGEGMDMTVVAAVAEDVMMMSFDCGAAGMDMYMTNENMYAYTTMNGSSEWTYAPITSEEEAESMMSVGEMARVTDEWNGIQRHTYRSAVVSNDITYDTLNVVVEDENGTYPCVFYVNRETQMVERYTCVRDGMDMDCYVTEAEPFSLPEAASKAKKVEIEDIATNMVAVIVAGAQGN